VSSVPVPRHRKNRKFRSIGKHAAPSQVEVVAQKAGKAVPTAVMVGALAVAPQAHASRGLARSAPVAERVIDFPLDAGVRSAHQAGAARPVPAAHPARPAHLERHADAARTYTVQPGDTLAGIAFRFYGRARAWRWLYQVNRAEITTPSLIFPGQVMRVPQGIPASFRGISTEASDTGKARDPQHTGGSAAVSSQSAGTGAPQGTVGCGGLEALWRSAGGAPAAEVTAASIAMAESSGEQYATGPFGERGYWQINPIHGGLSTYDAYGNARAAVIISGGGTNWSPWTTFVDGAYAGRC
jgi:LysM repeat protein